MRERDKEREEEREEEKEREGWREIGGTVKKRLGERRYRRKGKYNYRC
jgi:hypothetical protein